MPLETTCPACGEAYPFGQSHTCPRRSPRLAALAAAALLPLSAVTTVTVTAPAAHASTASVPSIWGSCNSMQKGLYGIFGGNVYRCMLVWGLGKVGYYWVLVRFGGSCGPAIADKPGNPAALPACAA